MISVYNLSKSYGDVEALTDISFSVKPGEIIGLLGPNGAGKTTLMKILTGYLHPSSGSAEVGGLDVLEQTRKVQEMIGYLPENAPLYPELTVQSSLKLIADLRGIPKSEQVKYLSEAIDAVGLESRLTRPIGTLSKGYRQRVGLAQAILHRPMLLILDEPTNGLDPTQIVEVRHLIKSLAKHSTVMISTHILSEVEATCDRAIIIMNGKLKADARLADLASATHVIATIASPDIDKEDPAGKLASLAGVQSVDIAGSEHPKTTYRIAGQSGHDLCPAVYQLARDNNWTLYELREGRRTLESVFNELAGNRGGLQ